MGLKEMLFLLSSYLILLQSQLVLGLAVTGSNGTYSNTSLSSSSLSNTHTSHISLLNSSTSSQSDHVDNTGAVSSSPLSYSSQPLSSTSASNATTARPASSLSNYQPIDTSRPVSSSANAYNSTVLSAASSIQTKAANVSVSANATTARPMSITSSTSVNASRPISFMSNSSLPVTRPYLQNVSSNATNSSLCPQQYSFDWSRPPYLAPTGSGDSYSSACQAAWGTYQDLSYSWYTRMYTTTTTGWANFSGQPPHVTTFTSWSSASQVSVSSPSGNVTAQQNQTACDDFPRANTASITSWSSTYKVITSTSYESAVPQVTSRLLPGCTLTEPIAPTPCFVAAASTSAGNTTSATQETVGVGQIPTMGLGGPRVQGCTIAASQVQLFYWPETTYGAPSCDSNGGLTWATVPPPQRTRTATMTIGPSLNGTYKNNTIIMTSPSVYLAVQGLSATEWIPGTDITATEARWNANTVVSMLPKDLSSIVRHVSGYTGSWQSEVNMIVSSKPTADSTWVMTESAEPYNLFNDQRPVPASAYFFAADAPGFDGPNGLPTDVTIRNDYHARISVPPQISAILQKFQTVDAACSMGLGGLYDPPSAITTEGGFTAFSPEGGLKTESSAAHGESSAMFGEGEPLPEETVPPKPGQPINSIKGTLNPVTPVAQPIQTAPAPGSPPQPPVQASPTAGPLPSPFPGNPATNIVHPQFPGPSPAPPPPPPPAPPAPGNPSPPGGPSPPQQPPVGPGPAPPAGNPNPPPAGAGNPGPAPQPGNPSPPPAGIPAPPPPASGPPPARQPPIGPGPAPQPGNPNPPPAGNPGPAPQPGSPNPLPAGNPGPAPPAPPNGPVPLPPQGASGGSPPPVANSPPNPQQAGAVGGLAPQDGNSGGGQFAPPGAPNGNPPAVQGPSGSNGGNGQFGNLVPGQQQNNQPNTNGQQVNDGGGSQPINGASPGSGNAPPPAVLPLPAAQQPPPPANQVINIGPGQTIAAQIQNSNPGAPPVQNVNPGVPPNAPQPGVPPAGAPQPGAQQAGAPQPGVPLVALPGGVTAVAGGAAATVSGHEVSLAPSASNLVVDGSVTQAIAVPSPANAPSVVANTVQGITTTGADGVARTGQVIAGQTLIPGATGAIVAGHSVSLANDGGFVIDGSSTAHAVVQTAMVSPNMLITLGPTQGGSPDQIVPASQTAFVGADGRSTAAQVIGGQTLTAGAPAATISGHAFSVGSNGAVVVDSSSTVTPNAAASSALITFNSNGAPQTLLASQTTFVGGDGKATTAQVVGGQTLTAGVAATTISGHVLSVASNGAIVVDSSSTVTPSASAAGASGLITLKNGNGAPQTLTGSQTYTIGSDGKTTSQEIVGGQTLNAGASAITISGHAMSLASNGAIVVDSSSTVTPSASAAGASGLITLKNGNGAPQTLTGSQTYTVGSDGKTTSQEIVGGQTLNAGASAVTISGHAMSLASNGAVVVDGTSTVTPSSLASPKPTDFSFTIPGVSKPVSVSMSSTVLVNGKTIPIDVVAGTTLSAGAAPSTIGGHLMSLASNGALVVDGTSTVGPVSPMTFSVSGVSKALTATATSKAGADGKTTSADVVDGTTIYAGAPAVTVDGHKMSLGTNGALVVDGTSTVGMTSTSDWLNSWMNATPSVKAAEASGTLKAPSQASGTASATGRKNSASRLGGDKTVLYWSIIVGFLVGWTLIL